MPAPIPSSPPALSLRHLGAGWLLVVLAGLAWDASPGDLWVMQRIGDPQGFAGRADWWLSAVLHDGLRQVLLIAYAGLWLWALWPQRRPGALPRRERLALPLLVLASLIAVNLVKAGSRTSCPWDLQVFGGTAAHLSHWRWGLSDGGPGRCFPSGHAASAFAFLPLVLPWWRPPAGAERARGTGTRWFVAVMALGLLTGAVQTLRGAHYPSHTLWTFVLCAALSLLLWEGLRRWWARP